MTKTVAETDRRSGLPFPGRCWTDRGHQDHARRRSYRLLSEPVEVDLRFGLSVWLEGSLGHTDGRGYLGDRPQGRRLRNLDVREHDVAFDLRALGGASLLDEHG